MWAANENGINNEADDSIITWSLMFMKPQYDKMGRAATKPDKVNIPVTK
jgi:hypothetical protein